MTAQRVWRLSSDTYNGEMHDTIHAANGDARSKDRYSDTSANEDNSFRNHIR